MWYASLDWANNHQDVVHIDDIGLQVASQRVVHSNAGLDELTSILEGIARSSKSEQLACIVGTDRELLFTALLEAGFATYPVNSKTVDRCRMVSGAKNDHIDAYLLAKLGHSDLADLR